MRTHFALLSCAALLATGVGLAVVSARRAELSASAGQRSGAFAPQKSAAASMVVYKSPT